MNWYIFPCIITESKYSMSLYNALNKQIFKQIVSINMFQIYIYEVSISKLKMVFRSQFLESYHSTETLLFSKLIINCLKN